MKPLGDMLTSVFHLEFISSSTVLLWHPALLLSKVHADSFTMLPLKAKLMSLVYAVTKCQVDVSDLFRHLRSCDNSACATPLACWSPWRYCNPDEDIPKPSKSLWSVPPSEAMVLYMISVVA